MSDETHCTDITAHETECFHGDRTYRFTMDDGCRVQWCLTCLKEIPRQNRVTSYIMVDEDGIPINPDDRTPTETIVFNHIADIPKHPDDGKLN